MDSPFGPTISVHKVKTRGGQGPKNVRRKVTNQTPGEITSNTFRDYYSKLGMGIDIVRSDTSEVKSMPYSRYMNMETLAQVYSFMNKYDILTFESLTDDRIINSFSRNIMHPYIINLMPQDLGSKDKFIINPRSQEDVKKVREEIFIKFQATFIRYILTVLNHRNKTSMIGNSQMMEDINMENYRLLVMRNIPLNFDSDTESESEDIIEENEEEVELD